MTLNRMLLVVMPMATMNRPNDLCVAASEHEQQLLQQHTHATNTHAPALGDVEARRQLGDGAVKRGRQCEGEADAQRPHKVLHRPDACVACVCAAVVRVGQAGDVRTALRASLFVSCDARCVRPPWCLHHTSLPHPPHHSTHPA
jgi:hypothetical protein